MRLRFGRVSLPILIVCAAVIGAIYYFVDNAPPRLTETTLITEEPLIAVISTQSPPTARPTETSIPTMETRFSTVRRQEIPIDSTIFIPSASIWSDVIQAYLTGGTWDIRNLRSNAGHLEGTSWVNQPGNTVISGHVELSNGAPGIFGSLDRLSLGDTITISSEGQDYFYVVSQTYYTVPTDLEPLKQTMDDRLTLITCNSYDIISNSYQERLIIVAERVS